MTASQRCIDKTATQKAKVSFRPTLHKRAGMHSIKSKLVTRPTWQKMRMPVGLWNRSTAVSTLFTFWPPAPPARAVVSSMSCRHGKGVGRQWRRASYRQHSEPPIRQHAGHHAALAHQRALRIPAAAARPCVCATALTPPSLTPQPSRRRCPADAAAQQTPPSAQPSKHRPQPSTALSPARLWVDRYRHIVHFGHDCHGGGGGVHAA